MKIFIAGLIVFQAVTIFLLFAAIDFRIEQETKICAMIQGADCSFLHPIGDRIHK